jgi:antirestriction protein
MSWENELVAERAREEARMEGMAQAHRDNYEEQCDGCGDWVDEDDLVPYQDQRLCPACHREYVLADFEALAEDIRIAFSEKTGKMAKELLSAMKK